MKNEKMTLAEMAAARKAEKLAQTMTTIDTISYLMDTFPSTDLLSVENNQTNHGRKICLRQNWGKQLLMAEIWVKGDQIEICAKDQMINLLSLVGTMTTPTITLPADEFHEKWAMKRKFTGSKEEMLSLATLIYLFNAYPLSMLPEKREETPAPAEEATAPAEEKPAKAPRKPSRGKSNKNQSK